MACNYRMRTSRTARSIIAMLLELINKQQASRASHGPPPFPRYSMWVAPKNGIKIWRTPRTPKMILMGTLALPGPLCSTLPSTSIMLGIMAAAIVFRLSVRNSKGGSSPNSRFLIGDAHPTARPAGIRHTVRSQTCLRMSQGQSRFIFVFLLNLYLLSN